MLKIGKCSGGYPTDLFAIFKLQNPSRGVFELLKISRSPDFGALKLGNVWSGMYKYVCTSCLVNSFHPRSVRRYISIYMRRRRK